MMRFLLLCLALLLAAPTAEAGSLLMLSGGGTSTPGGSTYILQDDFESGGAQWTKASGTASGNFAYATSPAPLVGSYSLLLDETSGGPLEYRNTTNWTAVTSTYAHARINITTIGTVPSADLTRVVWLGDSGANIICGAGIRDQSGTVRWAVQASGSTAYSSVTPVAGTTYYVWLEYVEGTGTGSCALYVATTSTKPGSPSAIRSSLTLTTDAVRLYLRAVLNISDGVIFDRVRVSNATIGSDPS